MSLPRVLTIGSAMVDIITIIADSDVERVTFHNATTSFLLVEPGRKIEAEEITIHIGGGAVNVAVSMRRLGCGVDVLSKLGRDLNADRIRRLFMAEGLGQDELLVSETDPTGSAVMIASHDRDAAIYTQRGANTSLRPEEVQAIDMAAYDTVYISPLSKASAECFTVAASQAAQAGCFTVATPGIRQITTRSPDLLNAMGSLDLLVMNAHEAAALVPSVMAHCQQCAVPIRNGNDRPAEMPERLRKGLKLQDEFIPLEWLMAALHGLGLKWFAMTDGRNGSYLCDGETIRHCPVLEVEVMGTAGAGDAFCSTLAYGLSTGTEPELAMRRAAANSASVVSHADTQTGLKPANELDRMIEAAGGLDMTSWPV